MAIKKRPNKPFEWAGRRAVLCFAATGLLPATHGQRYVRQREMESLEVVIYGAGTFAEYVSYVISQDSVYEVSAFCVEKKFKKQNSQSLRDLPIVDFEDVENNFPPDKYRLFISVGNNWAREKIFKISKYKGYSFISYLSSKAIIWEDLKCGENVFISEDSVMQPFVSIGDNTIILGSKIGHHSKVGNNFLLSCCFLGGNTSIGDNSFLGLNSTVQQNVTIGRNKIIGMGSSIAKTTGDDEVYGGKTTIKRNISSERIRDTFLFQR